jgi:hypothetical protein
MRSVLRTCITFKSLVTSYFKYTRMYEQSNAVYIRPEEDQVVEIYKGKGKVTPLQARCGPESG